MNLNRNFLVPILFHFSMYFIMYCTLSFLGFVKGIPSNESLSQWDVGWYKSIVANGYSFIPGEQSNVAFFPLFPLVWKFIGVSNVLISIVNLIFLIIGFYILWLNYKFDTRKFLLLLSIPSLFFCYVPYSEALFFMSGSLILYGLKNNYKLALLGMFLSCLTRSASLVFIPIILFSVLYNVKLNSNNKILIIKAVSLIFVALIATTLAQYIQYLDTGSFFKLFEAQKEWNREISFPKLFFTTWDGPRLIWLDGLAFLVGIVCFVFCVSFLRRKIINPQKKISADYLFAISYLALITIVTMLYSGEDAVGGTTFYSLNRFVFTSPFFVVFILFLFKKNMLSKKSVFLFVFLSAVVWISFGGLGNLDRMNIYDLPFFKTKIYFLIIFLYSSLYMLLSKPNIRKEIWIGVYLINVTLQIYLFSKFLQGVWIG